jgi:predicted nucleic acid-binding protein
VDASFAVAHCAKEPNRHPKTVAYLNLYARAGWQLFSPGVVVPETLFVLCNKKHGNPAKSIPPTLTATEHATAIQLFSTFMAAVSPPPSGDGSLILRADEILANYTCRDSSDSLYIALAERLIKDRKTELVTFDAAMESRAKAIVPGLVVTLLAP